MQDLGASCSALPLGLGPGWCAELHLWSGQVERSDGHRVPYAVVSGHSSFPLSTQQDFRVPAWCQAPSQRKPSSFPQGLSVARAPGAWGRRADFES